MDGFFNADSQNAKYLRKHLEPSCGAVYFNLEKIFSPLSLCFYPLLYAVWCDLSYLFICLFVCRFVWSNGWFVGWLNVCLLFWVIFEGKQKSLNFHTKCCRCRYCYCYIFLLFWPFSISYYCHCSCKPWLFFGKTLVMVDVNKVSSWTAL